MLTSLVLAAALVLSPLPGAEAPSTDLSTQLTAAWQSRPAGYAPRTRHLNPDGTPKYTNRLFLSASPYLRQHAHNPVNWYPWGDEAFAAAKRLNRPVLLSVGYSTCHWCHVMEEESFEDEEIARYLNEHYVAIKVDREERPDIDAIYMSALQELTGGGGWPMTMWLTADRRPFYGGTYFPPRDGERGAGAGFPTVLTKLAAVYHDQPEQVATAAASLAAEVRKNLAGAAPGELPATSVFAAAAATYRDRYDARFGGLRQGRKFPSDLPIRFLLRYQQRSGDAQALAMATQTLAQMAAGGIHDQVGGGFHRYATDPEWLVPHFEKMLYDNALLALAYLEAYQASGRDDFAAVARDILRDADRDMSLADGGFASATDADSAGPDGRRREGWFFTWTPVEITAALGPEAARRVIAAYGVTAAGNFEGRNILHQARATDAIAQELGITPAALRESLAAAREPLYAARARRPPPLRDDKVLAAWNGLMIAALARAALVLDDAAYAHRAARAAEFVLGRMRVDGRLRRSFAGGAAHHDAYLADYACMIAGLLDLYEATGERRWLDQSIALDRVLADHYEDAAGGFFATSDDHETLLAREKPADDGAEPSGNSVQALNLLRLYELTTDDRYRQRAERTLRAFARPLTDAPTSLAEMLLALDFAAGEPREIVIVVPHGRDEAAPFLAELRRQFVPNRVLVVAVEGQDLAHQAERVPLLTGKVPVGGRATAYVCKRRVCALPTSDPAVFAKQLR
jgi:uncharacterized protein YyaL (SSP411 family)